MSILSICLYISCFGEAIVTHLNKVKYQKDLKSLVSEKISLREDGKMNIPRNITHIKFDIGLSYNAPHSQYWLSHEKDLFVFGFEPNPAAVNCIYKGVVKRNPSHGEPLELKYIGKQFFLIPVAFGIHSSNTIDFFVTKEDCGCSSLFQPKTFEVERVIQVPIFQLSDFFELFPFDSHPVIDYIKIDAQGADLDIIKSAGHYLKERVIYITLEAENNQYINTKNSDLEIHQYMREIGFIPYDTPNTNDPTFFNPLFSEYVKNNEVKIYQN